MHGEDATDPTAFDALRRAVAGDHRLSLAQRLIDIAPAALGVDAAGVCELRTADARRLVAASEPSAAAAEEMQLTLGEGPCLLAALSDSEVLIDDVEKAPARLAAYARRASSHSPYRAVFCFPVRFAGVPIGALDLYVLTPGPYRGDLRRARALSAYLGWAVAAAEGIDPEVVPPWVDESHARWAVIHQAVGFLRSEHGCSAPVAFALLRARAFGDDRAMSDVACAVLGRTESIDPLER